jgi:hypothetical protein
MVTDKNFHEDLLNKLGERFAKNMARHPDAKWSSILAKLEKSPEKLKVLYEMEQTGGEPDVIGYDAKTDAFIYCDCSPESPIGRRSLCYDRKALDGRKNNKPNGNAMEMAATIGIEMLTETQYREMQALGEFDRKTSSWVMTPDTVRDLGGALFCDRRYDTVFVYHNGADSYYAARGFRGLLRV